jgi:ribosome-binding protein aMBF1 (putative translation factor)
VRSPKGRQGIRKDGKPRQIQKAPTSRADAVYGARLAVERRLKLLSQTTLAKKLGIQQGYLSTLERGVNPAPAALKAKIKKALGV